MTNKVSIKWLIWLTAIACLLALAVFSFLLFQSSKSTKIAKAEGYSANQIIVAVNQERMKNNLSPLIVNNQLMQAASGKVKDMADKSYFSHVSPIDGKKWSGFIKESGYVYAEAGENLANGYDSVESMVTAWMNSPTHRDNILNSGFVETGLAIEYGTLDDFPTIFVAQTFGRKEDSAKPAVTTNSINSPQPTVQNNSEPKPVLENIPQPEPKKYTPATTLAEIVSPFPNLDAK
jgi:uncharacterized protein YkwD